MLALILPHFTHHVSHAVRERYFHILRDAWALHPELHPQLRPPLLAWLGDPNASLRRQAVTFWHSALPQGLLERAEALLRDSLEGASSWVSFQSSVWVPPCGWVSFQVPETYVNGKSFLSPVFTYCWHPMQHNMMPSLVPQANTSLYSLLAQKTSFYSTAVCH